MLPIILRHIDPAKHVSRFYRLDVQPDLFGQWSLVREWGRIGSAGTLLMQSLSTQAEVEAAAAHVRRLKERKGYHDIAEQETSCIMLYAGSFRAVASTPRRSQRWCCSVARVR